MTGYKSFVAAMFIVLMAGSPVLAQADQRQPPSGTQYIKALLFGGPVRRRAWLLVSSQLSVGKC